ncbi:MAG TPA: class II fructose-bisphosphate aldolase [Firmicutes bacterium]|nr:class II fructose-bisphosphate aldolase [Candidatus Fermentithermobacillaceae bacterium]
MGLANLNDVLKDAYASSYAVGAFNAINMEFVQAIVRAAEDLNAPVIVQISQAAIDYAGMEEISAVARAVAEKASVPVVIHLDHATRLDVVERAIKAGFTSVMFDGSSLPLEENVKLTATVAKMAHDAGATAEGEIGRVPSAAKRSWTREELAELMTTPEEAAQFASRTGVDALAVSVGSVHKMKAQQAMVDSRRISEIKRVVGVPLVLHGSSGVTDESLREAVRSGIAKVNIATALSQDFLRAIRSRLAEDLSVSDARIVLDMARQAVASSVAEKIKLLGSAGKAAGNTRRIPGEMLRSDGPVKRDRALGERAAGLERRDAKDRSEDEPVE